MVGCEGLQANALWESSLTGCYTCQSVQDRWPYPAKSAHQPLPVHVGKEQLPQEFRDATIVHIHKRKGNCQSCDNHCGISLFSIAGKILACVLLNRLLLHLEKDLLPESQCGFRAGRGTVDMIFAVY